MINLIPNEEKKQMIRDFYLRLVIVFFITLSASVIIATINMLPAYFLVSTKNNVINEKLVTQQNEPLPLLSQETVSTSKNINAKLDLISNANKNKFLVSKRVIDEILSKKLPDIRITQITYQNSLSTGALISINGIAPSRERLLNFRLALEADTNFKKVDLPISNFIKGSDIQFSLNLIPS